MVTEKVTESLRDDWGVATTGPARRIVDPPRLKFRSRMLDGWSTHPA